MRGNAGRIFSILPLLLLAGIILACPQTGQAQTTSTWTGSGGDQFWNTAGNWNPSGAPNSSTVTVVITNPTNNTVFINTSPTIANLTLGTSTATDSLTLDNNQTFTVAGGAGAGSLAIAAGSTLTLDSTGNYTDLILSGTNATITLSGGGTLALSNIAYNRIYGTGSQTLVNSAGNTIEGSGQLGIGAGGNAFALSNAGIINANQSTALNVNPGNGMTNTGTIEATAGGTLNLAGSITNTGGTILSTGSGSIVNLAGAGTSTITGGMLSTTDGGVMYSGGSTLSGLSISANSTVTTANNSVTTLTGSVTNNGTIALNSGGNFTDLALSGGAALELTSGSSIAMSNSIYNRIYGSGTDTLTVDSGATIQGSGQIGLGGNAFALTNHGTIDANQSAAMYINPGNGTTNTGLIEATNGATLNLGGSFTNTGGTILSMGSGSTVNLSGEATSTITGGTLTTSGGGVMISDGTTLNGLTISSGSTVSTTNNNNTTLSGTITNNGTIALNSGGNYTDLILSGNVTLAGTGAISMSDYAYNRIYGATGSDQLTNGAGHTIEGSGQVGLGAGGSAFAFTNNGTVLANQSVSLVLNPGNGATNNGTMQVNAGSALEVLGGITNTGTVNVGQAGQAGSSLFLMGDAHDFVQTGGTTTLWTSGSNLELQSGQSMLLQGGTLQGFGTIAGNLSNTGGTVLPGTTGVAGILTVTGNYSDPMGSVLDIQIGGSVAGSGFSQLDVLGTASLAGTLDVNLLNGFTPTNGEEFVILTSGGLSGSFTDGVIHDGNVTFTVYYSPAGFANDVVLNAVVVSSVPEPASIVMLALGMAGVGALVVRRSRKAGQK
jgi:hypothetical protein